MKQAAMLITSILILSAAAPGTVNTATDQHQQETLYATFSLCAIDPDTGEAGAAVTTRVPFVGRAVPWVEAGVGAVATQSWTVVEYGRQGLSLMKEGKTPEQALELMLAKDEGRERRQVGIIDMQGRAAAFTGTECGQWAGSRQGENYTVQANIMVGPEVIEAVADHFEATAGTGMPLAERMILAMEAGQATGGDKRWGLFQSAAIKIADPNDPGRGGDHISLAIQVGEHPEPVAEMKRIYYKTQGRLGWREFSEIKGWDVLELKQMLHALGYWRTDLTSFPEAPSLDVAPELEQLDPEKYREARSAWLEERRAWFNTYAVYDQEAIEAVDQFRKDQGMDYYGNASGLVDEAFVQALRQEYYAWKKQNPEDSTQ